VAEVGSDNLKLNFRSTTSPPEMLLLLSPTTISISREVEVEVVVVGIRRVLVVAVVGRETDDRD